MIEHDPHTRTLDQRGRASAATVANDAQHRVGTCAVVFVLCGALRDIAHKHIIFIVLELHHHASISQLVRA